MRVSAGFPPGVTALLFDAARRRRRLEDRLVTTLEAAGYDEAVLPVLDYFEPYQPILSAASQAELYRFADGAGELLALRADFTPLLARLLAPRLAALDLPLRLFYRGDVVRRVPEHVGRRHELYQLGAELVGEDGAHAEREVLRLALTVLAASGVSGCEVAIGFAGALDRLLLAGREPVAACALGQAGARRERATARRASRELSTVIEQGVPEDPAELGEPAAERLAALVALRAELAAGFPAVGLGIDLAEFALQTLDPRLAAAAGDRGYYDGLVFRIYRRGGAGALGGGGRYDRLFARLGAPVPAAGFSLGLDPLVAAGGTEFGDSSLNSGERRPRAEGRIE